MEGVDAKELMPLVEHDSEDMKGFNSTICFWVSHVLWLMFGSKDVVLKNSKGERLGRARNCSYRKRFPQGVNVVKFLAPLLAGALEKDLSNLPQLNKLVWMTFSGTTCKELQSASHRKRLEFYLTQLESRQLEFFDLQLAATVLGADFLEVTGSTTLFELGEQIVI